MPSLQPSESLERSKADKVSPKAQAIVLAVLAAAVVVVAVLYLNSILKWLDAKRWRYWVPALSLFAGLFLSAWAIEVKKPAWIARICSGPTFAILLFAALLAFRWPTLTYNQQLSDPDESQMLAGAITLFHDPVLFRSVDGTTHGALNHVPFAIPRLLGRPIDYTTGRFVLLVINWSSLVMVWLGLRVFLPEQMARFSVLPAWTHYALATFDSIVQVGTEDLPAALVAAALFLVLKAWQSLESDKPGWHYLGLAGVVLGAVPFAKLQGVPPAIWLGIIACLVVFVSRLRPQEKVRHLLFLFAGALLVPVAILLMLGVTGIIPDFYEAYIRNNILYAQQKNYTLWWILTHFFETAKYVPGYRTYFIPITIAAALGFFALPFLKKKQILPIIIVIGYCLFSLYAMIAPGRTFFHYPRIYFVAASTLAGTLMALYFIEAERRRHPVFCVAIAGLFAAGTIGPQFYWRLNDQGTYCGQYKATHILKRDPAVNLIVKNARPGDCLAQWGWEPAFFVRTQLPQGTHDGHTQRQIEAGEQREYYRKRFIADINSNKPRIFIDTVGGEHFAYRDRATFGHEIYPSLRELIARDYNLAGDIDGTRIYIRKGND